MKKPKIKIHVWGPRGNPVGTVFVGGKCQQLLPLLHLPGASRKELRDRLKELCRSLGAALMEKGR